MIFCRAWRAAAIDSMMTREYVIQGEDAGSGLITGEMTMGKDMAFGLALMDLRAGAKIQRAGWNGRGNGCGFSSGVNTAR